MDNRWAGGKEKGKKKKGKLIQTAEFLITIRPYSGFHRDMKIKIGP